jgi:hypothetical protein
LTISQQIIAGIKWITPIHRWTSVVTIAFFAGTALWAIAVGLGLTTIRQGPSEALMAAYVAAQERNVDDFRDYLDEPGRAAFAQFSPEEVEALFDRLSYDGTTTTFSVLGLRNYGKFAVAGILQETSEPAAHVRVEVLHHEGRFWKMEWPIGESQWVESVERFDPYYIAPAALRTPTPSLEP